MDIQPNNPFAKPKENPMPKSTEYLRLEDGWYQPVFSTSDTLQKQLAHAGEDRLYYRTPLGPLVGISEVGRNLDGDLVVRSQAGRITTIPAGQLSNDGESLPIYRRVYAMTVKAKRLGRGHLGKTILRIDDPETGTSYENQHKKLESYRQQLKTVSVVLFGPRQISLSPTAIITFLP